MRQVLNSDNRPVLRVFGQGFGMVASRRLVPACGRRIAHGLSDSHRVPNTDAFRVYRTLASVGLSDNGVENRDNGIHTASVAARYAGKRPTLSGFAARTANSRHSDAPVRQCWISTAFGLMTNELRIQQRQSRRLRKRSFTR